MLTSVVVAVLAVAVIEELVEVTLELVEVDVTEVLLVV